LFVLAITFYLRNEVKMNKFFRVFVFSVAMLAVFPVLSSAATIIGTEDNATGFTGDIFQGAFAPFQVNVASDGEQGFFPFGATSDMSDAIQFVTTGFTWSLIKGNNWVSAGDGATFYLPAINENEPASEDIGKFQVDGGASWIQSVLGEYVILSADGSTSDVITLANDGVNGSATVRFTSDPLSIPEPTSLTLLGFGIAGLIGYGLRRRMKATA
jgi:hypothetical protein